MARQDTTRQLAGNSPMEMQSQYNISPDAPRNVPGVRHVAAPQTHNFGIEQDILDGLAEFGSKTIREAANARYTRIAAEGAMAYTQGKAVEDLPTDNNKWALEGYRVMEANTTSAALLAAQQAEISTSLYQLSPEEFRAQYGKRMEAALEGKDERVQDVLREQLMKAMPTLIEQHTREHAGYLETKNVEAVETAVDIMSRDTSNTDAVIGIASGEGAASALASDKQQAAVVSGVVRALANGNPNAYYVLKNEGFFDSLPADLANSLDAAKRQHDAKVKSEYNPARQSAEREIDRKIANNEYSPDEAAKAKADFEAEYGVDLTAQEASAAMDAADSAGAAENQSIQYEIKTAKLQGDYGKIADLTAPYANEAGRRGGSGSRTRLVARAQSAGKDAKHVENLTPAMADNLDALFESAPSNIRDGLQVGSGYRSVERQTQLWNEALAKYGSAAEARKWVAPPGRSQHNHGNAVDIWYNGVRLDKAPAEVREWVHANAGNFGLHFPLGNEAWHIEPAGVRGKGVAPKPTVGPVDQQKWRTSVEYAKGDLEVAAIVYSDGQAAADTWVQAGRDPSKLSAKAGAFANAVMQQVNGTKYETSQTRSARSQAVYEQVRERAQVEQASVIQARDIELDDAFKAGKIDYSTYTQERKANRDAYGVATTAADLKYAAGQQAQAAEAAARAAKAAADEQARIAKEQAKVAKEQERDAKVAAKAAADAKAAERAEMHRIAVAQGKADYDTKLEAITKQPKPSDMSQAEFNAMQQQQIAEATKQFETTLTTSAQQNQIPLAKQGISDAISVVAAQTKAALKRASENSQLATSIEHYVGTGSLNTAPAAVQQRAWEDHQANVKTTVMQSANTTGMKPDQIAEYKQDLDEDFFAKSNYVPPEVQSQMSGPLLGELVGKDGVPSPQALAAIQAYAQLRDKSSTAANKLLTTEAKIIAEAVLDASGGNTEAMPRVLGAMWNEGLGNKFRGQPVPNWGERVDIKKEVSDRVGNNGLLNWFGAQIFGASDYDHLNLTPESRSAMTSLLTSKVDAISKRLPDLNPKWILGQAEKEVLRSTAPYRSDPGAIEFDSTTALGWMGLEETTTNSFVIAQDGRDIWDDMFGAKADAYLADRSNFATAIDTYFRSDTFTGRYGQVRPTPPTTLEMAADSFVNTITFGMSMGNDTERMNAVPQYTIDSIKGGSAMVTFTLDDSGTEKTIVVPLREIGDFYQGTDKATNMK